MSTAELSTAIPFRAAYAQCPASHIDTMGLLEKEVRMARPHHMRVRGGTGPHESDDSPTSAAAAE